MQSPGRMLAVAAVAALFVASCASKKGGAPPPSPSEMERGEEAIATSEDDSDFEVDKSKDEAKTVPVAALVEGNNQFALDLLKHVESGSVAYSPYAVSMGGLLLESAAGTETKEELRTALRLRIDEGVLAEKTRILRGNVRSDSKHGFDPGVVHHVWMSRDLAPERTWLQSVNPNFDATVEFADTSDTDASRARIDETMATATVNAITGVTKDHDMKSGRLLIANAAAPRGAWAIPFERAMTRETLFTNADGTKGTRPVMRGSARLRYFEDGSAQVVAIPYEDGATAIIILPRDGTFSSVESALSYPKLKHYIANLRSQQVDVTLPKVEIETSLDLVPIFTSMGVSKAFDEEADFAPGLGSDSAPVDMFVHKTVFSLDEDGTRAQARSVQSPRGDGGVQFEATRPFLIFVRDDDTGQLLVVARVT